MDHFSIARVTPLNITALQSIARQTFKDTFESVNTTENMQKYLEETLSLQNLSAELANESSEFYFAQYDGKVIGYLKVNFGTSQTELKDKNAMEIERIYVLKDFHGKDVGKALYLKAIEIAKDKNADYIWLGVWERNTRAIRFYEKNGFEAFDKHIFKLGDDEQTDIMMKLRLKEDDGV